MKGTKKQLGGRSEFSCYEGSYQLWQGIQGQSPVWLGFKQLYSQPLWKFPHQHLFTNRWNHPSTCHHTYVHTYIRECVRTCV